MFSELKFLALLSSRPCSSTSRQVRAQHPSDTEPCQPQTCTKRAPRQRLGQECTPLPPLGELLPTWAVHSFNHSKLRDLTKDRSLGSRGFVLPVLLVMFLAAAHSLSTDGMWLWSTLNFSPGGSLYSDGRYSFPGLAVVVLHPPVFPKNIPGSIFLEKLLFLEKEFTLFVSLTLLHSLSILQDRMTYE